MRLPEVGKRLVDPADGPWRQLLQQLAVLAGLGSRNGGLESGSDQLADRTYLAPSCGIRENMTQGGSLAAAGAGAVAIQVESDHSIQDAHEGPYHQMDQALRKNPESV